MLSIRAVFSSVLTCVLSLTLAAQTPQPAPILANDNSTPAGTLENGVFTFSLEIRAGAWHPEAENGPRLFVEAFGETGKPARIPGPLMRVPANTTVHVTLTNTLKTPATVFGFVTHPASSDSGVQIAPNQTREITFASGAPGTYLYWARTTSPATAANGGRPLMPFLADAQLNGAFIVDSPGPVPPDRILVMDLMRVPPDILHPGFDVATINGKEYPYTEALQYTMGDIIRWRVINPSLIDHPMHLHGSFYKIASLGTADSETDYSPDEQQSVVTHDLTSGGTMMAEWTPSHPGRWLFHCHYHVHMSDDMRVPIYARSVATAYRPSEPAGMPLPTDPKDAMAGMGGMMMMVTVNAKPGSAPEKAARNPRRIELVLQADSTDPKSKLLSCSIREGGKVVTSHDRSTGPALILKRDQPVEITVINHLTEPTTIHWHGLELDSYYDGVMGGGMGDQVTPEISPGKSFVVRFTPNRAGTFIYHTHSPDPAQLANGIYGAIIVVDPGQSYDPSHDELLVIGARDVSLLATHITVNGSETIPELSLQHGMTYRIRVVNIAPNLEVDVMLGSKDSPLTWREIAKDGADVPGRRSNPGNAFVHIVSGETYDFELRPDQVGDFPISVENWFNKAKLSGEFQVR